MSSVAASSPRPKLLLLANSAWNVVNFRAGLIRRLSREGYDIVVAAPPDRFSAEVARLGARYVPVAMAPHGRSPLTDAALLTRLYRLMRRERPAAMLGFTIKPNIYGSLAARLLGVPTFNNISGLGKAFIGRSVASRVVPTLYRVALAEAHTIFFQNPDDLALFRTLGIVDRQRIAMLPGSGIDLGRFRPTPLPDRDVACVLMLARLLPEKGVREFVEAARTIRARQPAMRFVLAGTLDTGNKAAISAAELAQWIGDGVIEHAAGIDDVRPLIAAADCVVLPSYREGTPRALLEACAMGRPVIATDVPGCREVVRHGENGLLVPPRDGAALATAIETIGRLPWPARQAMATAGVARIAAVFDETLVLDAYVRALAIRA